MSIARDGLARRDIRDGRGRDETHFIEELAEIAETGRTPAERMLEQYETDWGGSVDPVFDAYCY